MKKDYITRIKANVNIFATKKTSNVLDGTYVSVFLGRSMNFEDLREYVPGDSIRDIDWKSSSRSRSLLVKRYVADKKHNIMLLMDTGTKMSAHTKEGASKKDVALYTAGTIAYLAYKNGDTIGSAYNKDGMIQYHQFKTGLVNIEKILSYCDAEMCLGKTNNMEKTFDYLINNFRRKMIIFIVTDKKGTSSLTETALKRLVCRHDVLICNISDSEITSGGLNCFDVGNDHYVPAFISSNKKLMKIEKENNARIVEENERKLLRHGIMTVSIDKEEEIVTKLIELLEKHKHANTR